MDLNFKISLWNVNKSWNDRFLALEQAVVMCRIDAKQIHEPKMVKLYEDALQNHHESNAWALCKSLQWRHYGHDGVSNHRRLGCLLNRLFMCRWRKHQSSALLAFVRGIHRWPLNSPHKGPVTRKMFPFDAVIMFSRCVQQAHGIIVEHSVLAVSNKVYTFMPLSNHTRHKSVPIWSLSLLALD